MLLRMQKQHIVLTDLVQQLIAEHAGIIPQMTGYNNDQRQKSLWLIRLPMLSSMPDHTPAARQPSQTNTEDHNEHNAKPKGGI